MPNNHISNNVVTTRFDVDNHWNVNAEGHSMDGYGMPTNAHGIYLRSNPQGLTPETYMMVLRPGFNFQAREETSMTSRRGGRRRTR